MMDVNFEIESITQIIYKDHIIDLHNNFLLNNLIEKDSTVTIRFEKGNGNWIHESEFQFIDFVLLNVDYSYQEHGDNTQFPEDENILSGITFFPSSNRESNNEFKLQRKPHVNDDLLLVFENDKILRYHCEMIELKTSK